MTRSSTIRLTRSLACIAALSVAMGCMKQSAECDGILACGDDRGGENTVAAAYDPADQYQAYYDPAADREDGDGGGGGSY